MKTPHPFKFTLALLLAILGLALIVMFLRSPMPPESGGLAPVAAENKESPPAANSTDTAAPPVAVPEPPGVAADAAAPMWGASKEFTGVKLEPRSAAAKKTRAQGGKLEGRSAPFDARSMVALASLQRGDVITLPLIGGEQVTGEVNLVQPDEGGWVRVGGALTGAEGGSFSVSQNGGQVAATILLPRRELAYQIAEVGAGRHALQEKWLGDVICFPLPRSKNEPPAAAAAGPVVLQATAPLSSRPTATAVLFLDFGGQTVTDPHWNNGNTIVAAASPLSAAEKTSVWQRVKEDFWPFNIDVTTNSARYSSAPIGRRMRCIITPTCSWYKDCEAGGVAYPNSFDRAGSSYSSTIPCWVFNESVKGIAEAVSHEFGHTLGLSHDGGIVANARTEGPEGHENEYYYGYLSDSDNTVGWAPIMGTSYHQNVTQWSKGEYAGANQTQDDVAIIANSTNGFGYVADEAGGARSSAAPLGAAGTVVAQAGIVTQASDVDYYVINVAAGTVNITANPAPESPNLDILLQLKQQDATGTVIASSNPDLALNASLSKSVAVGTYYVVVQGTGRGSVSGTGYSDYGSIGEYTLSGSIPTSPPVLIVPSDGSTSVTEGGATDTYTVALTRRPSATVTIALNGGGQLQLSSASLTFTTANWFTFRTVTVSALNDSVVEGAHTGVVTHTATSTDPVFSGVSIAAVSASIADAAPGDLDPLDLNLVGDYVFATAVQPDGKTIIAGSFSSVLGVPRSNIARLNADGTLDTGFNPKANDTVRSVTVQADGKVLLGGDFTTLQPNGAASTTTRWRIARVNADGTLDTGFDPKADNFIRSVAVQADGKVLLGGPFTTLQPNGAASPTPRQHIARVHANGTLDTGFDPKVNGFVRSVAVQADGKVLLGGDFTTLQPNGAASATTRWRIARVNADGTLDTGFDPEANDNVYSVAVQADGKVLLGGDFTTLQPNGTVSTTTRWRIARVHADGTLDTGFDPKANNTVWGVAVQADGKVLVGGEFTTIQPNGAASPSARNFFARLHNDPATQTFSAPDSSQALWQRGGAGPEVSRVTIELSTDGGASWASLGAGTRIGTTPNWQLTGLSLPTSGHLRARGRTTGGLYTGSSGLIEQVATFTFAADGDNDGLLDSWEMMYWGTTAGHSASDDFDRDGLPELLELAFGLNPTLSDATLQPKPTVEGGYLTITINRRPGATYEVQSAGNLSAGQPDSFSAGTTTVLLDNGTTLKVRDTVAIGAAPARFLRVKVTAAP